MDPHAAPLDHRTPAAGADRVPGRVAGQIAHKDVAQALFPGDSVSLVQGFARGWRQPLQLVRRVEARKVQGGVGAQLGGQPTAHGADVVEVIGVGRHDQPGDFDPDPFIAHHLQGAQHGLQGRLGNLFVEVVAEALQIDIGRVGDLAEIAQRGFFDIPGGDQHIADSPFAGQGRGVARVLVKDDGVGVGVGDRRDLALGRRVDEPGGRQIVVLQVLGPGLRDLPVLAVQAAQVAAGRGQRQNRLTGQKVVQRFLLHRVQVERAGVAVHQGVQLAFLDHPRAAEAPVALGQGAAVGAEQAADSAVVARFVPGCLARPLPQLRRGVVGETAPQPPAAGIGVEQQVVDGGGSQSQTAGAHDALLDELAPVSHGPPPGSSVFDGRGDAARPSAAAPRRCPPDTGCRRTSGASGSL